MDEGLAVVQHFVHEALDHWHDLLAKLASEYLRQLSVALAMTHGVAISPRHCWQPNLVSHASKK